MTGEHLLTARVPDGTTGCEDDDDDDNVDDEVDDDDENFV